MDQLKKRRCEGFVKAVSVVFAMKVVLIKGVRHETALVEGVRHKSRDN